MPAPGSRSTKSVPFPVAYPLIHTWPVAGLIAMDCGIALLVVATAGPMRFTQLKANALVYFATKASPVVPTEVILEVPGLTPELKSMVPRKTPVM